MLAFQLKATLCWVAAVPVPVKPSVVGEFAASLEKESVAVAVPDAAGANVTAKETGFEGRILAVDIKAAEAWGKTVSRNEAAGRPIGAMDAFLAATAELHQLTLVTRNVSDFPLLKSILTPWT